MATSCCRSTRRCSRLLDDAEPVGAETVALADAAGRVLAEPVDGAAHATALPRLGDGRLCGARRRPRRRPTACGDRRSAGRHAVRRRGRRRPGGAHLHRRAGAGRRRHDPHPGECAARRRGDGRGHRDRRRRPPHPARRARFRRRRNAARAPCACSMRRRCRWRLRPTTRRLPVIRRPLVAIIATGDELLPPGSTPGPGQIIASNAYGVAAIAACCRRRRASTSASCRDRRDEMSARIGEALDAKADIIVTLGGASVGDHDLVHEVLTGQGHAARFLEDRDAARASR